MAAHGELLHIDEPAALALRSARPPAELAERLAGRLRALGDPTRLALALSLQGGAELCVCDLSWIVERPQNLTSHHMGVLRAHGVVSARKQGKMTMYRLTSEGLELLRAAMSRAGEAV
jgi:DNA-binding transcriptional ArsR family regulator